MFIIKSYDDGSVSYAYEVGDEVILTEDVNFHNLYGDIYKTYKAGETVTIERRVGNELIPYSLSMYTIGGLEYLMSNSFKPADLRKLKSKPHAYVVSWTEGQTKQTLVAARSKKQAIKRTFAYTYFTPERMKGIKIESCELQSNSKHTKFFSALPLY